MTKAEIKAILSAYREATPQLDEKLRELAEWEKRYQGNLPACCALPMRELICQILLEVEEIGHKRNRAIELLNRLDGELQKEVLRRKYFLGQGWQRIQREMHYSERSIYQMHRDGLKELCRLENEKPGITPRPSDSHPQTG